jgi:hypothetical protein
MLLSCASVYIRNLWVCAWWWKMREWPTVHQLRPMLWLTLLRPKSRGLACHSYFNYMALWMHLSFQGSICFSVFRLQPRCNLNHCLRFPFVIWKFLSLSSELYGLVDFGGSFVWILFEFCSKFPSCFRGFHFELPLKVINFFSKFWSCLTGLIILYEHKNKE